MTAASTGPTQFLDSRAEGGTANADSRYLQDASSTLPGWRSDPDPAAAAAVVAPACLAVLFPALLLVSHCPRESEQLLLLLADARSGRLGDLHWRLLLGVAAAVGAGALRGNTEAVLWPCARWGLLGAPVAAAAACRITLGELVPALAAAGHDLRLCPAAVLVVRLSLDGGAASARPAAA